MNDSHLPAEVFPGQRIMLFGADGMLGSMVVRMVAGRCNILPLTIRDLDLTNMEALRHRITTEKPDLIINCAAYTNVDAAETDEAVALAINGAAPAIMAKAARDIGSMLIHVSTDYVFSGEHVAPYLETDMPDPLTAYGRTKLAGERSILESGLERFVIVRTSWLYGPNGKNFVDTILRLAHERTTMQVVDDQIGSPTFTGDLANALLRLAGKQMFGIFHFSNSGFCSWHGFACQAIEEARSCGIPLTVQTVEPVPTEAFPRPAPRPRYSVLDTTKYRFATQETIPSWHESLSHYVRRYHVSRGGD